jgi:two-component system, OmpR family, response regulator VicR
MKVLVCEDDRLMARAMQIVLEKAGYEVLVALDGGVAMDMIDKLFFSAIVVDIHLPHTSGLEIIGKLRNELNNNVPIMVVSAISDDVIQKQAFLLGANIYLLKPYDPNQLVKELNNLVKN